MELRNAFKELMKEKYKAESRPDIDKKLEDAGIDINIMDNAEFLIYVCVHECIHSKSNPKRKECRRLLLKCIEKIPKYYLEKDKGQ